MRSILLAAMFVIGAVAHAQTAPAGWAVEAGSEAWITTSPQTDAGQVRLVFYPAVKARGAFPFWFEEEENRRLWAYGSRVLGQTSHERMLSENAPALSTQARTLEDAHGDRIFVVAYGWETPEGRQLAQIVLPEAVGRESAAYKAAFAELAAAWRSAQVYVPQPAG